MSKWQSRRWWVCIWAMLCASGIILSGIISGNTPEGMGSALSLLIGVAGGYIAADSMTKPKGNP
jgi:hypothetical protein